MLYILLPAYNEEKSLAQLIPSIAEASAQFNQPYTICVVDDGSKDSSIALLQTLGRRAPLQIISHSVNQGYGAAILSGISWIVENGKEEDVVITSDADNSHLPDYYPTLLSKLAEGYPVVTASYELPGAKAIGVSPLRRLMSWGANTLLRLAVRLPGAVTYTNGFRAYRVSALKNAWARWHERLIQETGFPGGVELFVKTARAAGGRVAEIPFILHYENRGADSKINLGRTIRGYLHLIQTLKK